MATCVPAKAKKLVIVSECATAGPVAGTYRKRNVPTNSLAIAIKWFRGPLGIFIKKGEGLGPSNFCPVSWEDVAPVLCLLDLLLKTPGRKPDFAEYLSIVGTSGW